MEAETLTMRLEMRLKITSSSNVCDVSRKSSTQRIMKALPSVRSLRLVAGIVLVLILLYSTLVVIDLEFKLHQTFRLSRHIRTYPIKLLPHSCLSHSPVALLLAIKSHSLHRERRDAVRATWGWEGRRVGREVRRVFLLGLPDEDGVSAQVKKESEQYGDILLWDFQESFFNVTLKELLFWHWFQEECSGSVHYVLKGDDDVFVDVEGILDFLQQQQDPTKPLYVGHIIVDTYPVRWWWSKYYIPRSMYSNRPYPPYLGGGGYLISQETIRLLLEASSVVPLFPIDDAYVGFCAQVANVSARHHSSFMPFEFSPSLHPCTYMGVLVIHKLRPIDQHQLWNFFRDQGHTCPVILSIP